MDITPYLTAVVMLLGILVGTLITPKINQKVSTEHNRKDLIFKKKLEYFEKIAEVIEENRRMYQQIVGKLTCAKSKKEIKKIIEEVKQTRKKFLIKSSPLYFDTRILSEKIMNFVRIEKNIFYEAEKMNNSKDEFLETLKENVKRLNIKSNEIICEMKRELSRS
jgi:xanthosine utilization system XapX-like protein